MRPRGTPPTPSARSSESAPVGIASTLIAVVVAELHHRALRRTRARSGSRRPERRVLGLRVLPPVRRWPACLHDQGTLFSAITVLTFKSVDAQRDVLRPLRPEFRTVESDPDGIERLQSASGSGPGARRRRAGLASSRGARGGSLGHGHVRPERASRARRGRAASSRVGDLGLQRDRSLALGFEREQPRALPGGRGAGLGQEAELRRVRVPRPPRAIAADPLDRLLRR